MANLSGVSSTFNSRPHEEVDKRPPLLPLMMAIFQFTTSRRGRRKLPTRERLEKVLSIHDLTKRSTCFLCDRRCVTNLSIHDLTKRSTCWCRCWCRRTHLSIHDLTKRSTLPTLYAKETRASFQFTTSRRGRPPVSTAAVTGVSFQFTTSRRGRRLSRPSSAVSQYLSIHDLTKRSTIWIWCRNICRCLSIHDLTKRSTTASYFVRSFAKSFNSRPHEEVD